MEEECKNCKYYDEDGFCAFWARFKNEYNTCERFAEDERRSSN